MDELDISEYLGGGMDTGGFDFDTSGIGGLDLSEFTGGGFDTGGFNFEDLLSTSNLNLDEFTGGGMDTGGFNLEDLLNTGGVNLDEFSGGGFDTGGFNLDGEKPSIYDPNVKGTTGGKNAGYQTVGGDQIQINDDGSATGYNENGEPYALTKEQVDRMSGNKLLNSNESGYNAMTGGDKYAPGGGSSVTNANGSKTITMPGGTKYLQDTAGNTTKIGGPGGALDPNGTKTSGGVTPGGVTPGGKKGMDPSMMMMLMLLLSQMGKGGGGGGSSQASVPALSASRSQLPYSPPSRPGAGGTTYFSPMTYAPRMAGGGMANGGGISSLGGYSDGGRLLKGPGDGVSDGIPATIANKQPARLADGEFVVPARIVSELGNGSTEAGADRLYAMMDRVQKARRKTKNVAADTKAHKYLPA